MRPGAFDSTQDNDIEGSEVDLNLERKNGRMGSCLHRAPIMQTALLSIVGTLQGVHTPIPPFSAFDGDELKIESYKPTSVALRRTISRAKLRTAPAVPAVFLDEAVLFDTGSCFLAGRSGIRHDTLPFGSYLARRISEVLILPSKVVAFAVRNFSANETFEHLPRSSIDVEEVRTVDGALGIARPLPCHDARLRWFTNLRYWSSAGRVLLKPSVLHFQQCTCDWDGYLIARRA
nr:hypothetical protein CFP56_39028 [Quercus suber]